MEENHKRMHPQLAVICQDTLAIVGLRQMIQEAVPFVEVKGFNSFEEFESLRGQQKFFHYFVSLNIVIAHHDFFIKHQLQTLVLTTSDSAYSRMAEFRQLDVSQPEDRLARALIMLMQIGHEGGKNMPDIPDEDKPNTEKTHKTKNLLSRREAQVLALVAQGKINKEIADILNIGLTTVITHRKNIQEKLGIKSVSALTIFALTHGYVDLDKI